MNRAKAANFADGHRIADMLPVGKENATSTAVLCSLLGCGVRELRERIAAERMEGEIILSCSNGAGGYYLPSNREEVAECARTLKKRAISILCALHSANEYLKATEAIAHGQCTLGFDEIRTEMEVTEGVNHEYEANAVFTGTA